MSKEFVELVDRGIELAPAKLLTVEDYTYIDKDKEVTLFKPPVPSELSVSTLSGFVGLLERGFEDFETTATAVHVAAYDEVHLIDLASDKWGRRQKYVVAKALKPERTFAFNTFIAQEEFNINLRSMFVTTPELDELVEMAGNIAKISEIKQEDDGFSQQVNLKSGTHLVRTVTLKPRVTLKPFRTFLEVEQPSGDYIFRVQYDERRGNVCALFEADAGAWKLTAMRTVQIWLTNNLKGSEIEEVNAIPVVA